MRKINGQMVKNKSLFISVAPFTGLLCVALWDTTQTQTPKGSANVKTTKRFVFQLETLC